MKLIPEFINTKFKEGYFNGKFHAVAMSVDIKGFTALTEEMSKHGKEGIELLFSAINALFKPCIASVHKRGGFIISFLGDSFIAVFQSEYQNAVFSAFEIIRKFKKISKKIMKLHNYNISCKIGLAMGDVEWGIIGNKKRKTYYFRGNAISGCQIAERNCGMMEIVIDEPLMKKFETLLETELIEEGYYLVKKSLKQKYFTFDYHDIRSLKSKNFNMKFKSRTQKEIEHSIFISPKILGKKLLNELRDISSVYITFPDHNMDYNLLNRFFSDLFELLDKWGGYLSSISFTENGSQTLLIFGMPIAYEDNVERALNFINEFRNKYYFKAGITYGRLFCGFIGNSQRASYDVLGYSVNLSARISSAANDGRIWISRIISETARKNFYLKYAGEYLFKGKSNKLKIFELGNKKYLHSFSYDGIFYGRDKELLSLSKYINFIFDSKTGGSLFIYGEAGIGKSRLIHELISSFKSIWYCALYCDGIIRRGMNPIIYFLSYFFEQNPLYPQSKNELIFEKRFKALYEELIKHRGDKNELLKTKSFLKAILSLDTRGTLYEKLEKKDRHENTIIAILDFFRELSFLKPVIIHIEDAHWIDTESLNIISELCSNIKSHRIIIIFTMRLNDEGNEPDLKLSKDNANELILGKISDEEAVAMITDQLGYKADLALMEFIRKSALNNPFYIEQYCVFIKNSNIKTAEDIDIIKVPSKINQILTARIDRLPREIKELVKIASIFGKEFDCNILKYCLEDLFNSCNSHYHENDIFDIKALKHIVTSDIRHYLSEGSKENIWDILDNRYVFRHNLFQESAYEIQPGERLRILHGIAGSVIERIYPNNIDYYFDLAYHYEKAQNHKKTLEYFEKSGDNFKKLYRNEDAINAFKKLIKHTQDKKNLILTKLKIAEIYEVKGEYESLKSIIKECIIISEQIKDKELLAKSYNLMGNFHSIRTDRSKAIDYYEKALELFDQIGDKHGIAVVTHNLGTLYCMVRKTSKALYYLEKTIDLTQELGDKKLFAMTLCNMGVVYKDLENYDKALECYFKYKFISEEINDKRGIGLALGNMGNVYIELLEYDKAMECYDLQIQICEETGDMRGRAKAIGNTGDIYLRKGMIEEALQSYETYRKLSEIANDIICEANAIEKLGNLFYELEQYDKSLEYFLMFMEIFEKTNDKYEIFIANKNIGKAYFKLQKLDTALSHLFQAMEINSELNLDDREISEILKIISEIKSK